MTTNNTQFEKSLDGLRRISMTPREKGAIYHKLHLYTEANPVVSRAWYAVLFRALKSLVSVRVK